MTNAHHLCVKYCTRYIIIFKTIVVIDVKSDNGVNVFKQLYIFKYFFGIRILFISISIWKRILILNTCLHFIFIFCILHWKNHHIAASCWMLNRFKMLSRYWYYKTSVRQMVLYKKKQEYWPIYVQDNR